MLRKGEYQHGLAGVCSVPLSPQVGHTAQASIARFRRVVDQPYDPSRGFASPLPTRFRQSLKRHVRTVEQALRSLAVHLNFRLLRRTPVRLRSDLLGCKTRLAKSPDSPNPATIT